MPNESEEALIARLLDLPVSERTAYVQRAFEGRPGLRERLHQVALTIAALDPAVKSPRVPSSDDERSRALALAFAPEETESTTIGAYKLLQKIGEGGFGVVWMAEQQEPVRRRVALKVIKSGMDTREVIARFEAERQALAMMDHPNIARVFDAGATDVGQPYFVMELVRGISITRYCDENRLTTTARLNLFIAVCHAVQHAHQKGIIHRDLKPSNILVTLHDGVPMPKIIDFGIAKATATQLTDKTLFTRFHAFIGTPAYTSPEQMEMSGLDVDTRSDIYSLGVLLYELLAGQPPFDPDALMKSGLEAMRHTIREVDPPTPSQRVRTFSEEVRATVALKRGLNAAKFSLQLRGDLDWIVMHCLEKDRTHRYETANDLANDVRCYLTDLPVAARPPSAADRLRKTVRRNRPAFIAGTAVAVSLVVGLVLASLSLVRERSAREREAALRREADANAVKSAQVARFMTDMLKGVGPSVARGRDTTMLKEILDDTAKRLDTELRGQPEVAADLWATLGLVNRDLGRYAKAEPMLREVVAAHRQQFGNDSAEVATALDQLGEILTRLNKPDEAAIILQEALAIRRKRFDQEPTAVADTLFHLARFRMAQRTSEDVEKMLLEVLAIRRRAYGPEHPLIAETIAAQGTFARDIRGDHNRAVAFHSDAVAMYRKKLGNDHPDLAGALDDLGYSLVHIGRKAEANEAYRESYFLRRKLLGPEHPQLVTSLLRYVGQIPAVAASDETIGMVQKFITDQRKVLPPGSPLLAPSLLTLATLLDRPERNPDQAATLVREARALLDDSLINGSPLDIEVVNAMALYGWWKFLANDSSEGRTMCEMALKLARGAFGHTDRRVMLPNHILGWVFVGARQVEDAIPQLEETLRVIRAVYPRGHPFTNMNVTGLGAAYRAAGRTADSRRVLEDGLNADQKAGGANPYLPCELGFALNKEARFAEAEAILRESLRRYDLDKTSVVMPRIRPRACAESRLGAALTGQGKFAEAEPLVVRAFEAMKANQASYAGDVRGMVREAFDAVVALYTAWGKPDKVREWQELRP